MVNFTSPFRRDSLFFTSNLNSTDSFTGSKKKRSGSLSYDRVFLSFNLVISLGIFHSEIMVITLSLITNSRPI